MHRLDHDQGVLDIAEFVRMKLRRSRRIRPVQITQFGALLLRRVGSKWLFIPGEVTGLWNCLG
jgi:hypothetical protein